MIAAQSTRRASTAKVPRGLLWIDGVRSLSGSQVILDALCCRGFKTERSPINLITAMKGPLVDERASFYRERDTDMVLLQNRSLSECETCADPRDLLEPLSHGIRPSKRHHVYRFDGDPVVWIPALLLIRALFAGSRVTEKVLMCPNGVDFLGSAQLVDDAVEIVPGPLYSNPGRYAALPRLIAWTQTCADARQSHASVLHAASSGEISLRLPDARMTCWVRGLRTDGGLLVTEVNAVDLRFPIPADQIVLTSDKEVQCWPSYEPRKKSALSSFFQSARST